MVSLQVSLPFETLWLCLCPTGCKIKVRTSADTSDTPPKVAQWEKWKSG